jgi:hypothetical protein
MFLSIRILNCFQRKKANIFIQRKILASTPSVPKLLSLLTF